ncbi:MAG: Siroheme decarboxylase AhbA, alternate heme biosynthesis pathway / Siroheme decarboxylase AhbB, alternate heme biosynthesis pathway, partial [uncultured Rubrobacteraceae bacterium]
GPRPQRRGVRERARRDGRGDGHNRARLPLLHPRVQEDARAVLYAGDGGLGAPLRRRAAL